MIFPALKPIWYQLPSWYARSKGIRFEVNSIHRRGGKDVHHFSLAVQDAIEQGGVHYYAFPTRKWAEDSVFDEQFTVNGETRYFWEWIIPKQMKPIRKEKDSCIILKNNARIQLCGTDDGTFVGRGGKGYTLSEFSLHKNDVTAFIAPIITQSGGYLRMNGTLRGRDNHLWKMLQANKNNPEWYIQWLRPQDTKCYCWVGSGMNINPELLSRIGQVAPNYGRIINVQDLIDTRVTTYSKALQEYINEPTQLSENGYYQYEMSVAKGEKRLGNPAIKYDHSKPVFTFWDLGLGTATNSTDAMAVFFVQVPDENYTAPKQVNIIDYYEMRGRDWSHYAQVLNSKGYWYGNHYAPWDIAKGMAGHEKTNRDYARERGIQFQTVQRGAKLTIDIEDCRRFWPIVHSGVNEQVVMATELLMSYHEKLDGNRVGTGKPEHDASSNCFVGETMVWMKNGEKRIDEIVIGDEVRLDENTTAKVVDSWLENASADIIEIELFDGRKLRCTPNHPFFTKKGVARADELGVYSILSTKENRLWQHLLKKNTDLAESVTLSITESSGGDGAEERMRPKLEGNKNFFTMNYINRFTQKTVITVILKKIIGLMELAIQKTQQLEKKNRFSTAKRFIKKKPDTSFQGYLVLCKDMFGHIIMEKFQKALLFTIKTMINQTIRLKIWSYYLCLNILRFTQKQILGLNQKETSNSLDQSIIWQKHGTHQKKVLSGTLSMENLRGQKESLLKRYVVSAAQSMERIILRNLSTALSSVKVVREIKQKYPVYHITVETYHAYYVSGVLVKNCADAFRTIVRAFTTGIVQPNLGQNLDWEKNIKFDGYYD